MAGSWDQANGSNNRIWKRWSGAMMPHKLWALGEDAKNLVKGLIAQHNIDCYLRPGVAWSASTKSDVDESARIRRPHAPTL